MRLKVSESSVGDKIISFVQDDGITLGDFMLKLSEIGIDPKEIIGLRYGYPSRTIHIDGEADQSVTLDSFGISSGERINVVTGGGSNDKLNSKRLSPTRGGEPGMPEDLLKVRVVPDDNSCLFHSISFAMFNDLDDSYKLREIVSDKVVSNPRIYNEVILEKPTLVYSEWILQRESWGGGIEISILSDYFEVGIYVVDIDAVRIEKFNESQYAKFILILFNGIHYDCLYDANNYRTVFERGTDDKYVDESLKVAQRLKQGGKSFNTRAARIKCNQCGGIFTGERGVAKHAEATGHTDFVQAK